MYKFPNAAESRTWHGQMELIGGLIPYYRTGSLGLCFGLCINWSRQGRKLECYIKDHDQKAVESAQQILATNSKEAPSTREMILWSLQSIDPIGFDKKDYKLVSSEESKGRPITLHLEQKISEYVNSELDLILSFFYRNSKTGGLAGHAIAISFTSSSNECYLMDPNYGVAKYTNHKLLAMNTKALIRSYAWPEGRISSYYIIERDTSGDFGDFFTA